MTQKFVELEVIESDKSIVKVDVDLSEVITYQTPAKSHIKLHKIFQDSTDEFFDVHDNNDPKVTKGVDPNNVTLIFLKGYMINGHIACLPVNMPIDKFRKLLTKVKNANR